MGLIQSAEGLNRPKKKKKKISPEKEGILPSDCLWTAAVSLTLPWVSILSTHPADFRLSALTITSQFLKIHPSLLYIHISYCFSFSREH